MTRQSAAEPSARTAGEAGVPGLFLTPFELERDLAALVDLIVEANLADDDDEIPTVADMRNEFLHTTDFDAAKDVRLAYLDGELVGAAMRDVRARAGTVQHQLNGWVRPSHRGRGIGRALLHWNETRSRESAATWQGPEPHRFNVWTDDRNQGAIALLESEGYERVRYGFMMVRSLANPIPDLPLPDGFEVRSVVEADHRRIWDADTEAFRDHWEPAERTEEDFIGWYASPSIDTTMWKVAWDGDEVAGSVLNTIYAADEEMLGVRRGWLDHISVRRPWRRRGLAGALIAASLRELRDRGCEEAALGVDAENPSGALRLYESLGFRRFKTGVAYRKAL